MSLAEYLPKPPPVLSKLADLLGSLRAVQFVVAKISTLLGASKASVRPVVSEFSGETPGVPESIDDSERATISTPSSNDGVTEPADEAAGIARSLVDEDAVVLKQSDQDTNAEPGTIAEPEPNDLDDREKLIRRRWAETGIRLWNPDVHGAGKAALNIQGGVALLPPKPGGTLPRYDTLEYRMLRSRVDGQEVNRIVCEGVAVDQPQRRSRDGARRGQQRIVPPTLK
jgi:hypothetical protein